MSEQDAEIEWLKASVSCAALLERLPPVWRLDRAESTRRSLKYRRGEGEIVIVNHDGRGWWDPLSDGQGRHLHPRPASRPRPEFRATRAACCATSWGSRPRFPRPSARGGRGRRASLSPSGGSRRQPLSRGSPAWRYLTEQRGLPERILVAARAADAVREGPRGSAWFAHRDGAGRLTGIEMRGPDYRNFSAGGDKTLFRLPGGPGPLTRVAVCEAAIDALSLAAIERCASRHAVCRDRRRHGSGDRRRAPAASAGSGGRSGRHPDRRDRRRYRRPALRRPPGGRWRRKPAVRFDAILPPDGLNDWNDALRAMTPAP